MKLIQIFGTFWLISIVLLTVEVFNNWDDIRPHPTIWRWIITIGGNLYIIYYIQQRKYLASFATTCLAALLGFALTISSYSFSVSLLTFFITSSKATKFKKEMKSNFEEISGMVIKRDWKNVVCNGGIAALMSLFYLIESGSREVTIDFSKNYNSSWFAISVLGALGCANGDTWASELGTILSTGDPYLITSMKRVPKGTNGGVSTYGLLVSALGGLVIGMAFYIPLSLVGYDSGIAQWAPLLITGVFSGLFGSITDSLLGATLQFSGVNTKTGRIVEEMAPDVKHINGYQILDNNCVNLLSNIITAMVTPYFASHLWSYF